MEAFGPFSMGVHVLFETGSLDEQLLMNDANLVVKMTEGVT